MLSRRQFIKSVAMIAAAVACVSLPSAAAIVAAPPIGPDCHCADLELPTGYSVTLRGMGNMDGDYMASLDGCHTLQLKTPKGPLRIKLL